MKPLRILFLTSSLGVGGAEHHVLGLCRYLKGAGHEPSVCTLSRVEEGLEASFIGEGVPLFRLPLDSLRGLASPRFVSGLRRAIAASRPDIIHSHLYHAEIVAGFSALVRRVPAVTTRHSAGIEFRGSRAWIARLLSGRFAACVAVSDEAAREAVSSGFPRRLVEVVPNAVDPDRFKPAPPPERASRRAALAASLFPGAAGRDFLLVGSAGGLKPVKNFPLLVRAASRLAGAAGGEGAPEVRFVIVGEGSERGKIASLVRGLGLEARFALPGRRDDLEDLYPLLDVFVLPSSREGVPLALLEAMSSGVACVASDVGGIPGVLSGAGVLVRADDEDGFVRAMRRLVDDVGARTELGRLARVRVLERHSVEIWGERMLAVYRAAARRADVSEGPGPQNN